MATTAPGRPVKRFGWVKWVLLAALLIVGLPGGCAGLLFYKLANNDAARLAVQQAQAHPAVVAKLGAPLAIGRFGSGSISVDAGGTGNADLAVPVTGPKGAGRLHVKAKRSGGQWIIEEMFIVPGDGSSRISIVGGGVRT